MKHTSKLKEGRSAVIRSEEQALVKSRNAILSRKRPMALYQQVKAYVLDQIISNNWPPETRLSSENKLVETLNASKMTVNRALRELTAEGVLTRVQGVGTFVAAQKPVSTFLEIKPIGEEIAQKGRTYSYRIHLKARMRVQPDLALAMAISPEAEVFHTVIVHLDEGRPIQLEDRYVNPAVAPEFLNQDFYSITPSRYLLNEIPVSEIEHVVEAVLPDQQTQELLHIDPLEPCIVLNRRTWSDHSVVTRCRLTHPGSMYRIGGRFRPDSFHRTSEI
jgi:GntR family transcriptional regulator, histidine utilization repressor